MYRMYSIVAAGNFEKSPKFPFKENKTIRLARRDGESSGPGSRILSSSLPLTINNLYISVIYIYSTQGPRSQWFNLALSQSCAIGTPCTSLYHCRILYTLYSVFQSLLSVAALVLYSRASFLDPRAYFLDCRASFWILGPPFQILKPFLLTTEPLSGFQVLLSRY